MTFFAIGRLNLRGRLTIAAVACCLGATIQPVRAQSRDALFSDDTPPKSDAPTIAWHGFVRGELAYTYEIRELVPGERLVMSTSEGPFPMETTYTWGDAPGGTRMTLRNRGAPSGFARIVTPLIVRAMRRANEKDLRRLKQILERPG